MPTPGPIINHPHTTSRLHKTELFIKKGSDPPVLLHNKDSGDRAVHPVTRTQATAAADRAAEK